VSRDAAAPPAGSKLQHTGGEVLKLENGLYLWIDVKRFRLPEPVDSELDALDLLIRDPQFRDHYTSPNSQRDDATMHGPYRLSSISRESFEVADRLKAATVIDDFLSLYGGPGETKATEIRERIDPLIESASLVYRLRDLGEEAQHDFGWVLDDFNELVLVDLAGRNLALVVAAGD
jgi:hypothetical protein